MYVYVYKHIYAYIYSYIYKYTCIHTYPQLIYLYITYMSCHITYKSLNRHVTKLLLFEAASISALAASREDAT